MIIGSNYKLSKITKDYYTIEDFLEFESDVKGMIEKYNTDFLVKNFKNLTIDLVYGLIKNHLWLNHSLFQEIMKQYLMETYRLDRKTCGDLIAEFSQKVAKLFPSPLYQKFVKGDEHFLTYIFVQAMTVKDKDTLVEEIGLGLSILNKINKSAEYFSSKEDSLNQRFVVDTDDELIFYSVIENLSQLKSQFPWYLDSKLLLYRLHRSEDKWLDYLWEEGAIQICELLYLVGKKKILTHNEAELWLLEKIKNNSKFNKIYRNISSFIKFLESENLIYFSYYSFKGDASKEKKYIFLCPESFEFTARRFAHSHNIEELVPQFLLSLSEAWQFALIRKLSHVFDDIELTKKYLSLPLTPRSIEFLISQVRKEQEIEVLNVCKKSINRIISPSRRKAFCKGVTTFSHRDDVKDFLLMIEKEDRSEIVRKSATKALIKIASNPKLVGNNREILA